MKSKRDDVVANGATDKMLVNYIMYVHTDESLISSQMLAANPVYVSVRLSLKFTAPLTIHAFDSIFIP